uniref:Uncharacterized protein n=1 Tax=Heterorhabditis bacteriophora TaxID=37862 RepID=A0A1I7XT00_HETBA
MKQSKQAKTDDLSHENHQYIRKTSHDADYGEDIQSKNLLVTLNNDFSYESLNRRKNRPINGSRPLTAQHI